MTDPRRPTAEERFRALADYAAGAELDRIDALSPAEVAAELAALGLAPIPAQAPAEATDAPAAPARVDAGAAATGGMTWVLWVVAAVVLVAAALALWPKDQPSPSPSPKPPAPTPSAQPLVDAASLVADAIELRSRARDACDVADWRSCLDRLNAAAAIDPQGDRAPVFVEMRKRATLALQDGKKGSGGR